MTNELKLAIAKAISAKALKAARTELRHVGDTVVCQIDQWVKIQGDIKISADEEYIPTAHLSPVGLMAIALKRAGCTRNSLASVFQQLATEAIENGESFVELVAREGEAAETALAQVSGLTRNLPLAVRAGKTKANLTVTLA